MSSILENLIRYTVTSPNTLVTAIISIVLGVVASWYIPKKTEKKKGTKISIYFMLAIIVFIGLHTIAFFITTNKTVVIPDFTGKTIAEAELILKDIDDVLTVKIFEVADEKNPEDNIIDQSVKPGEYKLREINKFQLELFDNVAKGFSNQYIDGTWYTNYGEMFDWNVGDHKLTEIYKCRFHYDVPEGYPFDTIVLVLRRPTIITPYGKRSRLIELPDGSIGRFLDPAFDESIPEELELSEGLYHFAILKNAHNTPYTMNVALIESEWFYVDYNGEYNINFIKK